MDELGFHVPVSWLTTIGYSIVGLVVLLAYSPLADWIATRLVNTPPDLHAFRALQQSRIKLVLGIIVAWILGGVVEETVFRGLLVLRLEAWLSTQLLDPVASAIAICVAATGAGLVHLYQGLRAAIIVMQLSILFGVLFVVAGHDLWVVILCHGLYDTIAFIRFARKQSKYSQLGNA